MASAKLAELASGNEKWRGNCRFQTIFKVCRNSIQFWTIFIACRKKRSIKIVQSFVEQRKRAKTIKFCGTEYRWYSRNSCAKGGVQPCNLVNVGHRAAKSSRVNAMSDHFPSNLGCKIKQCLFREVVASRIFILAPQNCPRRKKANARENSTSFPHVAFAWDILRSIRLI